MFLPFSTDELVHLITMGELGYIEAQQRQYTNLYLVAQHGTTYDKEWEKTIEIFSNYNLKEEIKNLFDAWNTVFYKME